MNIENTKAQMRKGILEFCILSILKEDDRYTSEILDELKEARLLVVEGTVYPLLTRLKNDDLLTYRWEESTSGPPRKYYKLTEKGMQFLKELAVTWEDLSNAVNRITKKTIMNKTISINIGGQFFHIEEDAFTQLDHYINAIKLSIAEEGRDEIIDDIENRIAELFQQRITQPHGVIRKAEVEEIISIMGQPEDYIIDDNANTNAYSTANETNSQESKRVRKLYRDPDSKILGGVCSGIGHYFNIDPVWMRILFIVLVFFYGVSFLIYPILCIIIPKAVTPSQILEMKGIPVNINNIEKEVRDSLGKYVDGSKRIVSSGTTFIKKFIGITLVIFGTGGMFSSGIIAFIGIFENNHFVDIDRLNQYIDLPISMYTLALVFFLTCAIPFFIILLAGIKLLYSKMKHTRWIIGILGSIWLISCLFLGYVILKVGINKDRIENAIDNLTHTEITHKTDLQLTPQDTLVINFQSDSRLYSNDSLSYVAYKKSNNIEIEFAQSTLG